MMRAWCRVCREWVHDSHFATPDGTMLGCGQSRMDIRCHPISPRCGDIWAYDEWRAALVIDFVDASDVGVTFSDGTRKVFAGRGNLNIFVQRFFGPAELVSVFEDVPYPEGVNAWGFSIPNYVPRTDVSRRFIKRTLRGLRGPVAGMKS